MDPTVRHVQLRIPFITLVKLGVFALLVFLLYKLVAFLAMVYVAIMVAVVMAAASRWLEERHIRRGVALTLVATFIFGAVLLFLFAVVPAMFSELAQLARDGPRMAKRLEQQLPATAPYVQSILAQIRSPRGPTTEMLARSATAGWYALQAVTAILMTLVMSVYFVLEGKRALAWLFSFAPEERRKRLVRTAEEVEPVMLAYMRGQMITSTLSAAAALLALTPMHVPATIPLTVLAFVGDFVPVLGFIASLVPAVLLALLVSPTAAVVVVVVYVGYQLLENYVISPRVYGNAMRLSTLTVLLSIIVGGVIAGPFGAVLILPLAAAYPAVERIWLVHRLPEDTVDKHDAIESDDPDEAQRAADDVMNA